MELIDNRDEKGRFAEGTNIAQYTQLKYNNPEDIKREIDSYFDSLENKDKPTIAGLALHLGFLDRQSIYNYVTNPQNPCSNEVKKAIFRIENAHEQRLHNNGCAGSIFWLKQRGYKDNPDVNNLSDNALSDLLEKIKPSKGVLPKDE